MPTVLTFVYLIEAGLLAEDVIDTLLSNRQRQEFVQNDPLIVPPDLALGQLEDLVVRLIGKSGVLAQVVDDRVMKTQECRAEVSKDHVFVVLAISEEGGIVGVARGGQNGACRCERRLLRLGEGPRAA